MINAKKDNTFPLQASVAPMFHLLGSFAEDKAWIVHEGWHMFNYTEPSPTWRKDALAWLDKYLGPVGEQSKYERLSALANFAAVQGNWSAAADYYTQLTAEEMSKAESSTTRERIRFECSAWNWAAAALLVAENDTAYRELCTRMIKQFADREEPWIRERVLKACCLVRDGIDMSTIDVDATIHNLDQGDVPESFRSWTHIACAMAKLRSGDADRARHLAGRAVEGGKQGELLRTMSLMIQSLAHQELGETLEAQTSLDIAAKLIDEALPKADDGTLNPHFTMQGQTLQHDWIYAELLRREAEKLLADAPATLPE